MKRKEINFASAFEKVFVANQNRGIGGKQFAISGYGIADFVWLTPDKDLPAGETDMSLYAFEIKMENWNKALQQAFRYSYYADMPIVVLPKVTGERIQDRISLFHSMNIGLWFFDKATNLIEKLFTPEPQEKRIRNGREKALKLLLDRAHFSHLHEFANALA
ncbi:MAG: hypothetical protein V1913_18080 [Fibrobacterota bacterium]